MIRILLTLVGLWLVARLAWRALLGRPRRGNRADERRKADGSTSDYGDLTRQKISDADFEEISRE